MSSALTVQVSWELAKNACGLSHPVQAMKVSDALRDLHPTDHIRVAHAPLVTPMLRVGIAATANISRKTWAAIHASGMAVVVAVASRDIARAAAFIADCQSHFAFDVVPTAMSLDSMLENDAIDAVYVPTPTMTHATIVERAARCGKHVVCEKPCTADIRELEAMLGTCRSSSVTFFDGTMNTHGRRMGAVRSKLSEIGAVRSIHAVFTFNGGAAFEAGNIRVDPKLEPLGALGDVGWYCIRYAVDALGPASRPRVIRARGETVEAVNLVPVTFCGEVEFEVVRAPDSSPSHVRLTFFVSFRQAHQQSIVFSGTEGALRVPDFCLPWLGATSELSIDRHSISSADCRENHVRKTELITIEEPSTFQEAQLWRNAALMAAYRDNRDTQLMRDVASHRTWVSHVAMLLAFDSASSNTAAGTWLHPPPETTSVPWEVGVEASRERLDGMPAFLA